MKSEQCSLQSIQRRTYKELFHLTMLSLVVLLFGAGSALLWHLQQSNIKSQAYNTGANDLSVISPPSLSAATVNSIFTQMGSPMVGTGSVVESASRQANVDDAFALSVWWHETNDGEAGIGRADHNPGGVRASPGYPSAFDGYTIYPSYVTAIYDWFNILRSRYISRGLTTVYSIAYPYVGTSNSPVWASKVIALMEQYRGIAPPPPPPTPTPQLKAKPSPTVATVKHVQVTTSASILASSFHFPQQKSPLLVQKPILLNKSTVTQQPGSTLPSKTEIAIISFGLLAAAAIAIWSLMLGRNLPAPTQSVLSVPSEPETSTPLLLNEFSPLEQSEPTEQFPTWPASLPITPLEDIFSHSGAGKFPVRRVVLLPSRTDAVSQGEGSTSTTGLLSQYR